MFDNEIIEMGWLLHCNTGSFRKHKPSVPCSVLLSNNYVIVLITAKKSTFKFPSGFLFKAFLRSLTKKSRQNAPTLRQDVVLSIHQLYNYSILSFALVCLAKGCKHFVLPNAMKDRSESYFAEVASNT